MHDWNIGKNEVDKARIAQEWLTIKNTMWNLAGLIRSQDKLRSAAQIIRTLQSEVEQFYQNSRLDNSILSLRNGAQTALAIISSALEARESLGTHYVEGEYIKLSLRRTLSNTTAVLIRTIRSTIGISSNV